MTEPAAPRRLLLLINDAAFFVSHRLPLAAAAVQAGFDVHVALPFAAESVANQPFLDAIRATGARLHDLPMRRGGMGVLQEFLVVMRTGLLLWRLAPDILHCITVKPVLYGGALARLTRIPKVIFAISGLGYMFIAEGAKARLIRAIASVVYRFVLGNPRCRIIFQNQDDRDLFIARRLAPPGQTELIPGVGVDIQGFYPAPVAPPEPLIVLLPARLYQEKGVVEFVEAAKLLKAAGHRVRMVLAGYADFERPGGIAEAMLRQWCEAGWVEWWGHCVDMPNTLRRAHIVCLPSYREGFSKVLIEAGASGLPVVTTDVPGCRDAVRAGETALLVPPRNAAAIADALAQLLRDPAMRARLGANGRALVEQHYAVERFIAASLLLYRAS